MNRLLIFFLVCISTFRVYSQKPLVDKDIINYFGVDIGQLDSVSYLKKLHEINLKINLRPNDSIKTKVLLELADRYYDTGEESLSIDINKDS